MKREIIIKIPAVKSACIGFNLIRQKLFSHSVYIEIKNVEKKYQRRKAITNVINNRKWGKPMKYRKLKKNPKITIWQ